jgi:hypothetical protein
MAAKETGSEARGARTSPESETRQEAAPRGRRRMMRVWRTIFAVAALVNLAVGGAMLAAPARVAAQLGIGGPGGGYALAMVGLMIAVFGLGYALVAREPARHRGIVWIGMIGKLGAAGLAAMQYAAGLIPTSTFALGMGDVVFAALFALFLWRGPR